jgi:trans-aconitate methyltransferase
MFLATTLNPPREKSENWTGLSTGINLSPGKSITDWTIDLLEVNPYQHILELGCGGGYAIQELSRRLKVGFLAGIEESMTLFRKAYRRNRKLIQQELLQLHLGGIQDLQYPHHYFHSIYGTNIHFRWKEPQWIFSQMTSLLKTGGRLVMVFQPDRCTTQREIEDAAAQIKSEYNQAGLSRIHVEFRDFYPTTGIAITGFKD